MHVQTPLDLLQVHYWRIVYMALWLYGAVVAHIHVLYIYYSYSCIVRPRKRFLLLLCLVYSLQLLLLRSYKLPRCHVDPAHLHGSAYIWSNGLRNYYLQMPV